MYVCIIYGMKLDFKLRQRIWRAKVNKITNGRTRVLIYKKYKNSGIDGDNHRTYKLELIRSMVIINEIMLL